MESLKWSTYFNTLAFQGVCIGLSEVMGSAGKHQLLSFMDELIPTIRTALCDRYAFLLFLFVICTSCSHLAISIFYHNSTQEVRESAGLAFSTLYKVFELKPIMNF